MDNKTISQNIENLPDWNELSKAIRAYFSTDADDINAQIETTYSSLSGQIPMLPLRFFQRFINEKASLFSNTFDRQITGNEDEGSGKTFSQDELTEAEMWAERYLHLFKESAIKIDFDGEKASFLALDSNMYFHDDINHVWYLKVNENKTLAYVKVGGMAQAQIDQMLTFSQGNAESLQQLTDNNLEVGNNYEEFSPEAYTNHQSNSWDTSTAQEFISNNGVNNSLHTNNKKVMVFESIEPRSFESQLSSMDYNKTWEQNNFRRVQNQPLLNDFPLVEWKYYRLKKAHPHELAKMQRDFVTLLSWGFFNVSPKLLTQLVVKSSEDQQKLQDTMQNFGTTTMAIQVGRTDEIEVFNTGTIDVLRDLMTAYSTILEQSALQEGVDKNAIVSQLRIESGEAKKVELGYINKARNEFKVGARIMEQKIIDVLVKVYGFTLNYNGIVFSDLDLASDPVHDIEYATAMFINHYWTYEQAYAYVNKMSVEKAKENIEELGLEAPMPELMRNQVNDVALKKGFPEIEKVEVEEEQV